MLEVCRLCLDYLEAPPEHFTQSYENQIAVLLPEIDIHLTLTYSLCLDCSKSLEAAYTFRNKCIEKEEILTKYVKEMKPSVVDLISIKQQLDSKAIENNIKYEQSDNYDQVGVETGVSEDDSIAITFICEHCHLIFQEKQEFEMHFEECKSTYEFKPKQFEVDTLKNEVYLTNSSDPTCIDNSKKSIEKKQKFICEICEKEWPSHGKLVEHLSSHTGTKNYFCRICNKGFSIKSYLHAHEETHKGNTYGCPLCPKTFLSAQSLKRHKFNTHFGGHVCELCGMKCGSKAALKEHTRTHTGERPFKCHFCGKGFTQRGTLTTHIRCCHSEERPFVCEMCGKSFNFKGSLKKHKITHADKEKKDFVCTVQGCGKTFYSAVYLRCHVRRHELQNKFKCTLCEKAFKYRKHLNRHMLCHTGEKPYECHTCHKSFNQKSNLKIHYKSHRVKVEQSELKTN